MREDGNGKWNPINHTFLVVSFKWNLLGASNSYNPFAQGSIALFPFWVVLNAQGSIALQPCSLAIGAASRE